MPNLVLLTVAIYQFNPELQLNNELENNLEAAKLVSEISFLYLDISHEITGKFYFPNLFIV